MSNRYKGAVISATPPTTTGGEEGTASGAWTLEQQMQLQAAGLWPAQPTGPYIEQVFSTYLYTGNGSTQTITNGINLSGKGGLVWLKERSPNTADHNLVDTVRGVTSLLFSNLTNAAQIGGSPLDSFSSTGFVTNANGNSTNSLYATWTFREQPKFFDVVTYTGDGSNMTIPHNLGSVPGCIIVKRTNTTGNWAVYHRSLSNTEYLRLNTTGAVNTDATYWNSTTPTSTNFTVGTSLTGSGDTYVAYLFAHDAGGFGLTGTDNVISCGGFTHSGANAVQTLGYEPQFLLIKKTNDVGDWKIVDTMRGWSMSGPDLNLYPNTSGAEVDSGMYNPVATGFDWGQNGTFIYIAIRRGPMAVPTVGTSVFSPSTRAGTGASVTTSNLSFPPDMVWSKGRDNGGTNSGDFDRLRGATQQLSLNQTDGETVASTSLTGFDVMTGYKAGADAVQLTINATGYNYINWQFRRAPGFFDEVCYTGTGTAGQTYTHNLAAVPELMIVKGRSNVNNWRVYSSFTGATKYLNLNSVDSEQTLSSMWNDTAPTASVFTVGTNSGVNTSATTYVAYLFATCAGVSKVGSYTGTGTLTTINCGFTGGARFVLIKKSSGVGSWFVWDTARGMVSGTDPSLRLNVTDAEQSGDSIYSVATGFQLLASPFENINTNGDAYIFLAIA